MTLKKLDSRNQNHPYRAIALIGLRGCGKTSVGRELAAMLGGDLVDTDQRVMEVAQLSVTEIFAAEGQAGFRRREREVILELIASPPAVLSLGGGAVLDPRNVSDLKSVAHLIWLTAPPEVLWNRVAGDPASHVTRPPLTARRGVRELEELLAERAPVYRDAADVVVDTVGKTPRQIAASIVDHLQRGIAG